MRALYTLGVTLMCFLCMKLMIGTAFEAGCFAIALHDKFLSEVLKCANLSGRSFRTNIQDRKAHFMGIQFFLEFYFKKAIPKNCWLGFCGPWVEDYWIDNFSTRPLEEFGPFVPLFVRWNRFWAVNRSQYNMFMNQFMNFLRDDFLYVTFGQNDDGIEGSDTLRVRDNIFILSSGGKGHVPLPLFLRELKPEPSQTARYDISFMGTIRNHRIRQNLVEDGRRLMGDKFFNGSSGNWTSVYAVSKVIACPRGWGRNSFRLMETLQLGYVPLYVYNDVPWLPYFDSIEWKRIGFIARVDPERGINELPEVIEEIVRLPLDKLDEMRNYIRSLYKTHFTSEAMIQQIAAFLKGGFAASSLRCAARMTTRGK